MTAGARNEACLARFSALPVLFIAAQHRQRGSDTRRFLTSSWETTLPVSRPDSNDLAALAVAHAALDPARKAWRCDILISSVLQVLASKGPLSERELRQHIKDLWCTNAVDQAMLRDALKRAESANLLELRQRPRNVRWAATDASAWDARNDRNWAEKMLARFAQDVEVRIKPLLDGPAIDPARIPGLTKHLVAALRLASVNVFDAVVRAADPSKLTGIDLDLTAADSYLRGTADPKYVAEALTALTRASSDPADDFGAEILHAIVTGQVLQGMVARRDLPGPPPVAGSLLLLDTSTLVYRLRPAPQPQVFDEFLLASEEARCRVVVTRAVISEWESLWSAADDGAQDLANSSTGLPSGLGRLAGNPVLSSWQTKADDGRPQTWTEFQRKNRNIEGWLTAHRVQIIEDGEADPELVEQMRQELVRLSDAAPAQLRSSAGARTDAYSAALVAEERARNTAPIPQAWFIAKDQLTNKAYAAIRTKDRFPVASTMEAWLILLSAYDPARTRNLAEIVSDSVILNSFLAVSTGYGLDELMEISALLCQEPASDPDELAEIVGADFLALANSNGRDIAAELLRRRAIRRDKQVQRMAMQVDEAKRKLDLRHAEREQAERLRTENDRLRAENQRLRRGSCLSTSLAALATGIVISAWVGVPIWTVISAAVGWAAIGIEGIRWLKDPSVSASRFILAIGAAITWTVLASVLGIVFSQSAAPHAMRDPVPVRMSSAASTSVPVSMQASMDSDRGPYL